MAQQSFELSNTALLANHCCTSEDGTSTSCSTAAEVSVTSHTECVESVDLKHVDIPRVPKPKRPCTAYNLFFRDQYKKLESVGKNRKVMAAMISASWKAITPSMRLYYDQMVASDKIRYMNERIEYRNYLELVKDRQNRVDRQGEEAQLAFESKDEEPLKLPKTISVVRQDSTSSYDSSLLSGDIDTTQPCTQQEVKLLTQQLDADCIKFIIRVFK